MQVTELLQFIDWFNENIIERKLFEKYSQFSEKLNLNTRQGQSKRPFKEEKEKLFKALKSIDYQSLSLEQINFLEKLEIADLLRNQGAQKIDDILFESNIDIASASERVNSFKEKIEEAIKRVRNLEEALSDNFEIDETDEVSNNSILMRVYFQDDVSITNLTNFKKLSAMWYDIGRGIAMAQNKSPEDFNIIGAKKGSIIIEMVIGVSLATAVSKILLESLKVADRYLEILKKVQELKSLKLSNKKAEEELKKEAQKEKDDGVKNILDVAISDLKLNVNQQGDKINAIEKSIKKLVDFTQKGGEVDFVQPTETEEEEENGLRNEVKNLKDNISKIRLLENRIKLLENKDN